MNYFRITIVDIQMARVYDVIEVTSLTDLVDMLPADYRQSGYRWFVTPAGQLPEHTSPEMYQ